jgi:hypothetical protein
MSAQIQVSTKKRSIHRVTTIFSLAIITSVGMNKRKLTPDKKRASERRDREKIFGKRRRAIHHYGDGWEAMEMKGRSEEYL